jgi:predicted DNA-binding WGR domain protein
LKTSSIRALKPVFEMRRPPRLEFGELALDPRVPIGDDSGSNPRKPEEAQMPRYELVEGTSSKFWEVTLNGTYFDTCYGKIGTSGSVTRKEWDSEEKARKEYDKLVAEKVKKGYKLVGAGGGGGATKAKADKPVKAEKAEKAEKPSKAADGGGSSGWLRYEFVEGTSAKFWAIKLDGAGFETKYGKIGTDGTVTRKDWDSEEKARKEYDKLIAEKVKKGYEAV